MRIEPKLDLWEAREMASQQTVIFVQKSTRCWGDDPETISCLEYSYDSLGLCPVHREEILG